MPTDPYENRSDGMRGWYATNDFDITPHATDPLEIIPLAVYVGTGGDLVVRLKDADSDRTYKNVPDGTTLSIRPKFVRSSSTAADLVGMY